MDPAAHPVIRLSGGRTNAYIHAIAHCGAERDNKSHPLANANQLAAAHTNSHRNVNTCAHPLGYCHTDGNAHATRDSDDHAERYGYTHPPACPPEHSDTDGCG